MSLHNTRSIRISQFKKNNCDLTSKIFSLSLGQETTNRTNKVPAVGWDGGKFALETAQRRHNGFMLCRSPRGGRRQTTPAWLQEDISVRKLSKAVESQMCLNPYDRVSVDQASTTKLGGCSAPGRSMMRGAWACIQPGGNSAGGPCLTALG
ncbi:hypothetical protein CIHG_06844 [Coccidioides immitis H538.4]|uniref:Uncharacterized protein n=3 Tax=Coccidioides immitis TaxID=5501 RepID=A0A0J8TUI3_COCIT|nr:hypothetical protein CIRG_04396 [Coccidioides immitis RMSCC 2394]KMU77482.1 hypothetical protein CISG_06484 [Coccidioides immitis RMSCC 3703]KMU89042.1 hypothetical protein CIHG_06844 [Coccidioides immitis H538.4]